MDWLRAVTICLVLVAALARAAAAEAATTAILRPRSSAPELNETLFRLKGELLSVGLSVEVVEPPQLGTNDRRAALSQMAADRALDVIIEIVGEPAPVAVDVWLFKQAPQRSEVSRVEIETNRENAAEALAIRAIDVVRSRLLEIDLSARKKQRPAPDASEPAQAPRSSARSLERIGLAAGAAVLTSLDGVGPAIVPLLRLDWALHPRLSLQATLAALGSRPSVVAAAGKTRVAQEYALLGVCYCMSAEPGLAPFAAVAGGALHTSLEGSANAPATGHAVAQWSFVLEGSIGARFRASGPFFLTLASNAQFAEPYVSIHFVDAAVASTGRPNLVFALTAGAWL